MNSIDYSKGDISRARTAEYYPGQSASGPFYNPNLQHSFGAGQSLPDSRVYPGDASRYYYAPQHSTHSYEQYANRVINLNQPANHQLLESQHVKFRLPEEAHYVQNQPSSSVPAQSQYPTYYNDHARYLVQQQTVQPQYQRQFLSFRPMMASQLNQVPQSKLRLDQRSSEPYHEYDFKVYCPACHQQYYNSQVQEHIERHYLYNTDQYKISTFLDSTNAAHEEAPRPLTNQSRFIYPLVEPQQFECKELDEVNYLNKYKLHHEEKNKKESNVKVKSQSTQFAKPPLQIRSENTDIYNCFDNIFSSKNEFSVSDLTKSNTILAKKRQLEDWEKLRSQKEGFTIKKQ